MNGHSRSRWSRTHRRRRSSSVRRGTYERRILLQQARTFRDLEALFVALDAMGKWKELADQAARLVFSLSQHFCCCSIHFPPAFPSHVLMGSHGEVCYNKLMKKSRHRSSPCFMVGYSTLKMVATLIWSP